MGNAVIFKPATQGAISGIKMVEALHKAGLPKGLVNVATGRGSVIGDLLSRTRRHQYGIVHRWYKHR